MQVELLLRAFVEELLGIGGLHLILNLSRKARILGMCIYGNIPLAVWEEFVDQKKMAEAVALSVQQKEKAIKAAENPHRLGSRGHAAKMAKWRKEEEERRVAGLPAIFEGMDERSRNWILARVPAIPPDDNVSFQKPSTEQIYQKLEGLAEMQKNGLFVPDREKDMLTARSERLSTLAVFEGFLLPCLGVKHFVNTDQVIRSGTVIRSNLKTR
jgi:hypothetical protein